MHVAAAMGWVGGQLRLTSGIELAWHRGITVENPRRAGLWPVLASKLILVVISIALAAVHGLLASSRPRLARPLGISGLLVALAVVVFATALVP